MEDKRILRARMRHLRREMTEVERTGQNERIRDMLARDKVWRNAERIAFYAALPDEVSTWDMLQDAWAQKKRVYLPRIDPRKKGLMNFYRCESLTDLERGKMGIREPVATEDRLLEGLPDLMLIPGLAFDRCGNRLGYGGGFYDRFLSSHSGSGCKRLGLAFEFQLLPQVPHDGHDHKIDGLCTEKGIWWLNT